MPCCCINQARFQSNENTLGMGGGHVSVPAPYLDVEGAAFELTTSGHQQPPGYWVWLPMAVVTASGVMT
jgi:hypothetical protein